MTLYFNKFLYDWLKENQLYEPVIREILKYVCRDYRFHNVKKVNSLDCFNWERSIEGIEFWLHKYNQTYDGCNACNEIIQIKTNEKTKTGGNRHL
jgi:hypothetical protein